MSLKFIITFHAKPDSKEAFLEIMQQVKIELPVVEGCEGVQVMQGVDDPCIFTLFEAWENKEAHQANSQKLMDSGSWDHIVGLLASEPDGSYLKAI